MRITSVLSPADLPWPELQAARLDGELFAVDACYCPIDEPDGLRLRALALAAVVPRRLIAELHSAAWVWGALEHPPVRHRLCADITARTRPPIGTAILREVVVDAQDVDNIGALRISSPLRTAVDLARLDDAVDLGIVARLFTIGDFGLEACHVLIERRRNLPDKHRARQRLAAAAALVPFGELVDQPPVTR